MIAECLFADKKIVLELDSDKISREVCGCSWIINDVNVWGNEFYFKLPIKEALSKDAKMTTDIDVGDVVFWTEGESLCVFWGSTPMSAEDGKPVPAFPVIKIGKVIEGLEKLNMINGTSSVNVLIRKED